MRRDTVISGPYGEACEEARPDRTSPATRCVAFNEPACGIDKRD